jgi:Fe-S cluster assembly protein SufD
MNATDGYNNYLSCFPQFEKNIASRDIPWLSQIRNSAMSQFARTGFPTTRDEEWRFTSVSPIAKIPFRLFDGSCSGLVAADIANFAFSDSECAQLVFVDGHYCERFSCMQDLTDGARVMNLAEALREEPHLLQARLAQQTTRNQNAFAALNAAFMSDGAFVQIPPGRNEKSFIHLLFLSTGRAEPTVSFPRNLIIVGSGSQATIVESYAGMRKGLYFTNAVTEIVIEDGGILDHYKLQRESEDAYHVASMHVRQERDSNFTAHCLSLGGAIVRNDVNVTLNDQGGDCILNGLYVTKGQQHVDNHTSIDHAKPHCSSRELYKGILGGKSSGVFTGKIMVRKDAQKTNARQTNKNLLLSESALVNTKPQLEIFADDVKCTHGASIGRLDDEALFYLRSRGIEESAARTLLTYAFATEILSGVQIKPIQCQLDLVLLSRLSRVS